MSTITIRGNFVDIFAEHIYPAELVVENGKILSVTPIDDKSEVEGFILPGFIDSHVHIESSMLVPSEFARLAVVHGTVSTVSDPHEIANVCGVEGVEYMIANGKQVPFKFYFGAPSCVPATVFETAGARIDPEQVERLLRKKEIKYLSEMMNFPGVLAGEEEVMQKIKAAINLDKPIDGHAPGLRGDKAKQYIDAGMSTDHECFTADEALDKLKYGMKILIREGSAARNFEALIDLLNDYPESIMFCSDDKHPDSLVAGHINQLCARAVQKDINIYNVLRAACINPVFHYKLDTGILRAGDAADFVIVEDLKNFKVRQTYIDGILVAENGRSLIQRQAEDTSAPINNFECNLKREDDFRFNYQPIDDTEALKSFVNFPSVIEALDGQLITNRIMGNVPLIGSWLESNIEEDILKIVVVNRYASAPIAKGFIKNFSLKSGAIASSVAHDSHNIVAVGTDDEAMCRAVNLVIEKKGGVSCVGDDAEMILALPVAGLMSANDGYAIADAYTKIDAMAKSLGSTLQSPFMTLSFMALLVIPHLKLSDLGLFDGDSFTFV